MRTRKQNAMGHEEPPLVKGPKDSILEGRAEEDVQDIAGEPTTAKWASFIGVAESALSGPSIEYRESICRPDAWLEQFAKSNTPIPMELRSSLVTVVNKSRKAPPEKINKVKFRAAGKQMLGDPTLNNRSG